MDDRLMMSSSDEQDDVAPMTGSERISIDDCFFKTPPSSPDRVSRSLSLYSPIKNSLHLSPVLASIHLKDADRSMQGTVSDAYDDVPAHRLFAFNASDSGNTSCDMDDFAFGSPSDDVMPEDVSDLDDDDDMFEFGFSTKSSQLGQPASSANTNEGLQHQTHSAEDQEMSEEQMDLDIDDFLSNCDINAVEANADGSANLKFDIFWWTLILIPPFLQKCNHIGSAEGVHWLSATVGVLRSSSDSRSRQRR